MPDHEREILICRLKKETDNIKDKFIILEIRLRKFLIRSEIPAKDVIRIFAKRNLEYHKECDTIDKLLDEAEKHWSFFDYDLMELLILCLFEEEQHHLRVLLKDYNTSFKDYARRRICECPSNVFEEDKERNSGKVVVFKIEKCNFETMTVDKLKQLRLRLNSAIGSYSYRLRLLKIDSGCVQLTFRILPSADEMIQKLTREEKQALRKVGVLRITYEEQTLNLLGEKAVYEDDKEAAKNRTSGNIIATGTWLDDDKSVLRSVCMCL